MKNQPFLCESFKPFVNRRSQILILGSMPGPEALRKQQYYGFTGNHFWTILSALFNERKPLTYNKKLNLLRRNLDFAVTLFEYSWSDQCRHKITSKDRVEGCSLFVFRKILKTKNLFTACIATLTS